MRSKDPVNPAIQLSVTQAGKTSLVWVFPGQPQMGDQTPFTFELKDGKLAHFTGWKSRTNRANGAYGLVACSWDADCGRVLHGSHAVLGGPVTKANGELVLWVGGAFNKNRDRFEDFYAQVIDAIREELNTGGSTKRGRKRRHASRRVKPVVEARNMSRATVEVKTEHELEAQPTSGNALLVFVSLGMAFLLIVALLGVAKSGNLFSESNLLYVALIFYSGAAALYMGFGVTGIERYVKFASVATMIGLVANTLAAGHRWYEAGHPPFASLYEMLLSFVWTVALLTLFCERKYKVKIIGTVTMPLAVVGVILMQLLPSEVRPLVPALQSTWLHVHVTLAMLAYAACAMSFALAMMFLIKDNMKTETFLAATSAMVTAIYISMMIRFESWGGFSVVAWDPQDKQEVFLSRGVRLFLTIPDLGWIFVIALIAAATPLALYTPVEDSQRRIANGFRQPGNLRFDLAAGSRSRGIHLQSEDWHFYLA